MKLSKESKIFLLASLLLFGSLLFAVDKGIEIRTEEFANMRAKELEGAERARVENPGKIHFGIYHGPEPDRNWAEDSSVALLVMTLSTLTVALWLRKR